MRSQRPANLLLPLFLTVLVSNAAVAQQPPLQELLKQGKTRTAVATLTQIVNSRPEDHQASFELGIAQFLVAIEDLGQAQYRYGLLGGRRLMLPLTRLPVPENNSPQLLSWQAARDVIRQFRDSLLQAETTLSRVKPSEVRVALDFAAIHLDLNGNGQPAPEESLLFIFNAISRQQTPAQPAENENTLIHFDDGDVLWLRSYCHILSATCEMMLAYDWKDLFERTAHLFYPRVETPYNYLAREGTGPFAGFHAGNALDLVAFIHGINFPLMEADAMKRALAHLEAVPPLSRQSWKLINAETDNDREWLPNPQQSAAFSQSFRISPAMQTQWLRMLDEIELILQGKRLLPFWRGIPGGIAPFADTIPTNAELGINLRKVFMEPQRFDLVLCLQGTGLHPFLEKGPITQPRTWAEINSAFQGQFLIFSLWIN